MKLCSTCQRFVEKCGRKTTEANTMACLRIGYARVRREYRREMKTGNDYVRLLHDMQAQRDVLQVRCETLRELADSAAAEQDAVKYIARAGHKDPTKTAEDLKKAIFYLRRRVWILEGKPEPWSP